MKTAFVMVACVLLCACGAESADPPPPDTPVSNTADDGQPVGDVGGEPADCPEGSQPHQGMPPEGCDFVHEGCCYATAAAACAQAGCAEADCSILESYPAQVRCD